MLLIVGAGLVLPLPVPIGIFLFAGGMILILRNSRKARWLWARLKRRWPTIGSLVDRAMRAPPRSAVPPGQRRRPDVDL